MSHDTFDLRRFSGKVPLFPLPGSVLFPGTLLPFHIFEPRYRRMIREVAPRERLIGVALFRPGWEADYQGRPPVRDVVGIGRIVRLQRLAAGRFNIVLEGLFRGRIRSEEPVGMHPYRVALIEPLIDVPPGHEGHERAQLLASFERYRKVRFASPAVMAPEANLPLGALAFQIAAISDLDAESKQKVLEADAAEERARVLADLLDARRRSLAALQRRLIIPRDVSWN
jgi:Lon protease-like protein